MLREFDLDAPREQKHERLRFRDQTRCITALFERFYKGSRALTDAWKILIEVVDKVDDDTSYRRFDGILTVQIEGDVEGFFAMDNCSKKEQALEYLTKGIAKLSAQMNWDASQFFEVERQLKAVGLVNEWRWRSIANASGTLSVDVYVEHDVQEVRISARFFGSDGALLGSVLLLSDQPNDFVFDQYFGELQWLDDNVVELVSRDGQKRFKAKLYHGDSSRVD